MEVIQAQSAYQEAEASIKSAQAAVETARRQLGWCSIVAPCDGDITDVTVDVGNYVSGEAAPFTLATIYDNSVMRADFAIEDERYQQILKAKADNDSLNFNDVPVEFSENLPDKYTGHLSYIAPALQTSTGTLSLECLINNPKDELRAGMYVKVKLPYQRVPNAVLVKDASVGTDQLGKYLYVVNDSNRVVYTPISVGDLYEDTLRVVNSGIKAGDKYVTKALLKVRDGMTVNPKLVK